MDADNLALKAPAGQRQPRTRMPRTDRWEES